jgi:hypothetical protein
MILALYLLECIGVTDTAAQSAANLFGVQICDILDYTSTVKNKAD